MKIEKPNIQISKKIFLSIIFLVYCVQIATAVNFVKVAISNKATAIIVGLLVYTVEILIIKRYLKNYKKLLWLPFQMRKVTLGLLAFLFVLGINTLSVWQFDQHKVFPGYDDLSTYLLVFFLNLVPSALTEEWLFRFFPAAIAPSNSTWYSLLFFIGITFLFMLTHLPKYYFQGNIMGLYTVFVSGIAFLLIYQATQNLPFVILIHAFTNSACFVYESSSNWLFLYATIIMVSLAWGGYNLMTDKFAQSPNGG